MSELESNLSLIVSWEKYSYLLVSSALSSLLVARMIAIDWLK